MLTTLVNNIYVLNTLVNNNIYVLTTLVNNIYVLTTLVNNNIYVLTTLVNNNIYVLTTLVNNIYICTHHSSKQSTVHVNTGFILNIDLLTGTVIIISSDP